VAYYSFAAIELLPISFDLVLRADYVIHVSYLAIDCELVDVNLIFRVADVYFGHVFDNFAKEVAGIHFFIFVKGILEHDFGLFIKPNFKNDQFVVVKQSNEVIFDDWYDLKDVGEVESLEDHVAAGFGELGREEIVRIVAKQYFSVNSIGDSG
jgi:hypothetical protein